jgi:hypothetical protein
MRYGIPDAYIAPMFTIHVSLFSYCSIWMPVLELKTLKTRYANVSCAYKMFYLLTRLKLFSNVVSGHWWCHHVMVMSLTGYFPVLGGWVALLILTHTGWCYLIRGDILFLCALSFMCVD